jgi:hypothetical protein
MGSPTDRVPSRKLKSKTEREIRRIGSMMQPVGRRNGSLAKCSASRRSSALAPLACNGA